MHLFRCIIIRFIRWNRCLNSRLLFLLLCLFILKTLIHISRCFKIIKHVLFLGIKFLVFKLVLSIIYTSFKTIESINLILCNPSWFRKCHFWIFLYQLLLLLLLLQLLTLFTFVCARLLYLNCSDIVPIDRILLKVTWICDHKFIELVLLVIVQLCKHETMSLSVHTSVGRV